MTVHLFAMAASLRSDSWNRKLIKVAAAIAREAGATVDLAMFDEFAMPLYDADLQAESGLPPGALALIERITPADGLMLAIPEYNYSIPGAFKNAVDWLSRRRPMPTRGKTAVLLSTSNGKYGGARGLFQSRVPLECVGLVVLPEMFPLPLAEQAFAEDGGLKDPAQRDRLTTLVRRFLEVTARLQGL